MRPSPHCTDLSHQICLATGLQSPGLDRSARSACLGLLSNGSCCDASRTTGDWSDRGKPVPFTELGYLTYLAIVSNHLKKIPSYCPCSLGLLCSNRKLFVALLNLLFASSNSRTACTKPLYSRLNRRNIITRVAIHQIASITMVIAKGMVRPGAEREKNDCTRIQPTRAIS